MSHLPRKHKQSFSSLFLRNLTWLKTQVQIVQTAISNSYKDAKKIVFPILEKSATTGGRSTLQKAICNILKTYLWFIIPILNILFNLNLRYIYQKSSHLGLAFTMGMYGTVEGEDLIQQQLQSLGSVWRLWLGTVFPVARFQKIIHLRAAIAWKVSQGGKVRKPEALHIN